MGTGAGCFHLVVGEVAGVFLASLQGVPLEEAMKAFRALLNVAR